MIEIGEQLPELVEDQHNKASNRVGDLVSYTCYGLVGLATWNLLHRPVVVQCRVGVAENIRALLKERYGEVD